MTIILIYISGRKLSLEYDTGEEAFTKAQNAKVLCRYAAAMMRALKEMNYDKFNLKTKPDFKLR